MYNTFFITLDVATAADMLIKEVVNGSITGELIDDYSIHSAGGACRVLVFEKHFYRAGNRLTLTVTLDNLSGSTRVHFVGGGGGEGFFRFDWGASGSFERTVENVFSSYRM